MEVEIKVRIENLNDFERKIKDMGAVFQGEMVEEDWYFNHPCRDFAITDEALRIRNDGTLTYKGPKVDRDTKSREEINLKIENLDYARQLIERLGFKFVAKVKKVRRYYKMGELNLCLDNVKDLGTFMEVECIGEYEDCRKRVLNFAQKLGLKNFITRSYLEMLLDKKRGDSQ